MRKKKLIRAKKALRRSSVVNLHLTITTRESYALLWKVILFGWRSHTTGQFPEAQKLF